MPTIPTTTTSGAGSSAMSGAGATTCTTRPWLLLLGDSKTEGDSWPGLLRGLAPSPQPWALVNLAAPGTNVTSTAPIIATVLAATTIAQTPTVLINLGVNDMGNYTLDSYGAATWIPAYQTILDGVRARWPSAPIYVTKPWMRTKDVNADLMAGWVTTLVASRPNCFVGTDERGFYKGADDGATNTIDGVHPTDPVGENAIAVAWKAVLWP